MKLWFTCLLSLVLSVSSLSATSNTGWVWINYLGASESFNSMLFIDLEGEDNISLGNADWKGRALTNSAYYAVKLEKWKKNKGYGLEWVHHKIYLSNTDSIKGIDSFSISDGFNMLFFNRILPLKRFGKQHFLRFGAGFVFAHMDVTLTGRDRIYMDGGIRGSYFAGAAAQIALDKWVKTFKHHFVTIESKFTVAYCRGPVSTNFSEYSVVPNYAFHILVGVGNKPTTPRSLKDAVKTFSIPSIYMGTTGFLVKQIDTLTK